MNYNSNLTSYLKKISRKIIPYLKYFKIKRSDIISIGLFFNVIGIYCLHEGDFALFVIFFLFGQFTNIINKLYEPEVKDEIIDTYSNIAEWVKFLALLEIFTKLYRHLITDNIVFISFVILILCNIHYSVNSCIKLKNNIEIDYYIKCWIKPICNVKIEKLKEISKYTKYFDENMVFLYIMLIIIYIHILSLYN
jgi:hypothetical protein